MTEASRAEVRRIERDFLYNPGFHGYDLKVAWQKYEKYLDGIGSRHDLNYLLDELLAGLSLQHVYLFGGDVPTPPGAGRTATGRDAGRAASGRQADAHPDVKPRTDTEKLQGTWEVLETRMNGETYPTDEKTDHRLVIEGDRFHLTCMPKESARPKLGIYGGTFFLATFKLNTTTSPRKIDLEMSKDPESHEVCLGIYKLDGDDLMICLPYLKPCERRPTEFKAEKGSDQQLYKLRRAKPVKK